jgi:hypothetical protein
MASSRRRPPAAAYNRRSRGAHALVRQEGIVEIRVIVSRPHQARSTEACAGLTGLLGRYLGGIGVLDCPRATASCLPDLPELPCRSSRRRASPTRGGRRRRYARDEKCDLVDEQCFSLLSSERACWRGTEETRPATGCPPNASLLEGHPHVGKPGNSAF